MKNLLTRYIVSSIGLMLVALGIALSVVSNLGTSPLSCPSYLLTLWFGLSVGGWTVIINTFLIFVQLVVMRDLFKAKYLMQVLASLVFGYMIDFWMWVFSDFVAGSYLTRILLVFLSSVVTAFGVSLEVESEAWMLSAEMTVYAFTKRIDRSFGDIKIVMDSLCVVVVVVACFIVYRNPFGTGEFTGFVDLIMAKMPGIVVGLGTLLLAFLPGYMMRFTNPLVKRWKGGGSGKWMGNYSGR